jgi:hypothetical protein
MKVKIAGGRTIGFWMRLKELGIREHWRETRVDDLRLASIKHIRPFPCEVMIADTEPPIVSVAAD